MVGESRGVEEAAEMFWSAADCKQLLTGHKVEHDTVIIR